MANIQRIWEHRPRLGFRSIRTAFILSAIIPFILAVILLTSLILQGSRRAVDNVLEELRGSIFEIVNSEIIHKLSVAYDLNEKHSRSWERENLNLEDESSRERYFVTAIEGVPDAAMTFIGLEDGQFYGSRRIATGEIEVVRNNALTGGASEYYSTSELGNGLEFVERYENFDPRTRPWYSKAKEQQASVFSDIYSHFVFKEPTITASKPIYNDGELIGVFGVDLLMSWLGETLNQLPIGANGNVFIVDHNNNIVALSSGLSAPIPAVESEHSIVRIATQQPEEFYLSRLPNLSIDGQEYLFSREKLQVYGLDWDIYIALAQTDFLSQMNKTVKNVYWHIALFVVSFVVFAFWLSKQITRPIIELNEAAKDLTRGNFTMLGSTGRRDELGQLTSSFNAMGTQLTSLVTHLEGEVQARTAELQKALDSKDEFLANMSHEIRSPMNVIIGMSDLVLDSSLGSEQREYIDMVNRSAKMLLRVINQVLDYSKIEAGKVSLLKEPFSLRDSIEQMIEIYAFNARGKNLTITAEYDNEIPQWIQGDVVCLQQVLINLIGNAIKYTERGTITVSAGLVRHEGNQLVVRICVNDEGIGIPEDKIEKLFKSFSQVDNSLTRKYSGTGLGLVISKNLVEMMGGQINVESEVGKGSNFCFTVQAETATMPEKTEKLVRNASTVHDDKTVTEEKTPMLVSEMPAHILVVEDMKMNQRLAQAVLEKMGWKVTVVENGQQALDMLEKETFDLILMDIQMPIMDGIEATRRIRSKGSESHAYGSIPIIAMTANAMEGDQEKYLHAGMNDYISKPFERRQIFSIIEKHLAARKL